MSFKCCKIMFEHQLMLSFNAVNTTFMCKICIKYQYVSHAVCRIFKNDQGVRLLEHVR